MKYPFLSQEWIAAAKAIGDEYAGRAKPVPVEIKVNQVITGAPDGVDVHAHIDTSAGAMLVELGHLEAPDVTVTTDYATAKALLVDQDAAAAMQAFMEGRIKLDGDPSKLMMLQAQQLQVDPIAAEVAQRIRDITAD